MFLEDEMILAIAVVVAVVAVALAVHYKVMSARI